MSVFSARCNVYISRLCYDVSFRLSVRLSVTELHWRIANLGFKFRSQFTTHCGRDACGRKHYSSVGARKGSSPGRVEGSSRAMLATARHSCIYTASYVTNALNVLVPAVPHKQICLKQMFETVNTATRRPAIVRGKSSGSRRRGTWMR